MLCIVASYRCIKFQGKLMHKTWENGKKPSFGTDFGPFVPNLGPKDFWILTLLDVRHSCKLSLYMIFHGKLKKQTWKNGKKNLVLGPKEFWILPLLDVRHSCKLSLYMIFHRKLMKQTWKNGKKKLALGRFWPKFRPPKSGSVSY